MTEMKARQVRKTANTMQRCNGRTLAAFALAIVVIATANDPAFAATDAVKQRYAEYCSVCHGDRGDGRSHAQQGLVPPPRDFTAPAFANATRERIVSAITNGMPGSAMVAWQSVFTPDEVEELADFVLAEFVQGAKDAATSMTPSITEPARIYAESCSVCHGDDGKGAKWGQESLSAKPRDFTTALSRAELTRDRMIVAVSYGRPGTPMPGFSSQLSREQIAGVVDYVRARFMAGGSGPQAMSAAQPAPADAASYRAQPLPNGLSGNFSRGQALYLVNCVECHGVAGDGNGPRAYFIFPKPRNFRDAATQNILNRPRLYTGIADGVLGKEMPAWSKVFSDQEIADVAEFVYREFITATPAN